MNMTTRRILPVALGAVGFFLRLVQQRTAFDPDTGLSVPGAAIPPAAGGFFQIPGSGFALPTALGVY